MAQPHVGRLRLAALCVAVACRAAAYTAVTVLCVSLLQGGHYAAYRPAALAAWLGLSALPALVLAPFIGPLAGSRWNRAVLVGGTALVVAVLGWAWSAGDAPWLPIVGYLSLELAFFAASVAALIPAVAGVARLSPTTTRLALVLSAAVGVWLASAAISCSRRARRSWRSASRSPLYSPSWRWPLARRTRCRWPRAS